MNSSRPYAHSLRTARRLFHTANNNDLKICLGLEPPLHGPLSKRRGSEKKAYLGEMKAWLGSIVAICTSMCAYNMCYSGTLSKC